MKSSLGALQTAIYQCLSNNQALMDKLTGIYDEVPQKKVNLNTDNIPLDSSYSLQNDTLFPFVTIGEDYASDWSTKTNSGQEVNSTIHTWSRYKGFKETKELHSLIIQSITESELLMDGFDIQLVQLEMEQVFRDADGKTRHGVLRFKFLIDEK